MRELDRRVCREYVSKRFSLEAMTDGYEAVYRQLLADKFSQRNGYFRNEVSLGKSGI